MSSKYFVALATPTVELPVETTDARGDKAKIYAGFKRYDTDGMKAQFDRYTEINKEVQDLNERMLDKYESYKIVDGVKVPSGEMTEAGEKIDPSILEEAQARLVKNTNAFIAENVVYIKGIELFDHAGTSILKIADTRTYDDKKVLAEEGFEKALDFALSLYLPHNSWRNAFMSGVVKALINQEEAKKAAGKNS